MKKRVQTHRYPCWIVCNEDGCIEVYRAKGMNLDTLPPKPKRHRSGEKSYSRCGYIVVEYPPLEEGKGRWEYDPKYANRFGFTKEASQKMFPEITWESEPVKGHMSFNIEID